MILFLRLLSKPDSHVLNLRFSSLTTGLAPVEACLLTRKRGVSSIAPSALVSVERCLCRRKHRPTGTSPWDKPGRGENRNVGSLCCLTNIRSTGTSPSGVGLRNF
jgi:hypothetical protein